MSRNYYLIQKSKTSFNSVFEEPQTTRYDQINFKGYNIFKNLHRQNTTLLKNVLKDTQKLLKNQKILKISTQKKSHSMSKKRPSNQIDQRIMMQTLVKIKKDRKKTNTRNLLRVNNQKNFVLRQQFKGQFSQQRRGHLSGVRSLSKVKEASKQESQFWITQKRSSRRMGVSRLNATNSFETHPFLSYQAQVSDKIQKSFDFNTSLKLDVMKKGFNCEEGIERMEKIRNKVVKKYPKFRLKKIERKDSLEVKKRNQKAQSNDKMSRTTKHDDKTSKKSDFSGMLQKLLDRNSKARIFNLDPPSKVKPSRDSYAAYLQKKLREGRSKNRNQAIDENMLGGAELEAINSVIV